MSLVEAPTNGSIYAFLRPSKIRVVRVIASVSPVLFGLVLLTGCNGQSKMTAQEQSSSDPIEKFLGTDGVANRRSSELARGQRIQLCMKRLGFVYVPFANVIAVKRADGGYAANLRENGYGISDAMELTIPKDPNDELAKALSRTDFAAYLIALDGKETGAVRSVGCRQMAEGGAEADQVLARVGQSGSRFEVEMNADPKIRKIDTAWSACMRSKGYGSLAHPSDVVPNVVFPLRNRVVADSSLTKSEKIASIRILELAVARVDARCMPDQVRAARTKIANTYRSALLDANKADFERLRSFYH
jgi:hypothetical protein